MGVRMHVRVVPGAAKDEVKEVEGILIARVRAPAHDNKANISLLKLLSRHFKHTVRLVSGLRGKNKVVEIGD